MPLLGPSQIHSPEPHIRDLEAVVTMVYLQGKLEKYFSILDQNSSL